MNGEPAADASIQRLSSITAEGVLREIKVDDISREAHAVAEKYGYMPYMIERYFRMLGYEETLKLLESFEHFDKKPAILCNYLRSNCEVVVDKLNSLSFSLKRIEWCSYCYTVVAAPTSPSIGSTHEYLKGYYYVYRDKASLIAPLILNPGVGSLTLDMCAAPGGKAIHILLLMHDSGLLVANDISTRRAASLLSHFIRMGFKSYIVLNEDGIELVKKLRLKFDYILVDAPCSAEGSIMFDPSRKIKTSVKDLAKLVEREIKLLYAATTLVRNGGKIVYTTCSIAPEENEYVVTKVLQLNDKMSIKPPPFNYWSHGLSEYSTLEFDEDVKNCIRIWPHRHNMEGYFICLLSKTP
jgi:NOL1/NOP2/sun family putative RNA methylase